MKRIFFTTLALLLATMSHANEAIDLDAELAKAKKGNADSALHVGKYYYDGMPERRPDIKKSVPFLTIAAAKGKSAPAKYRLGMIYFYGQGGIKADKSRGSRLMCELAKQGYEPAFKEIEKMTGDSHAMSLVGSCYMKGNFVEANPQTAVIFWKKAVALDGGNGDALLGLANAYDKGMGIDQSKRQSEEHMLKAAMAGNDTACMILSHSAKNFSERKKWKKTREELLSRRSEANRKNTEQLAKEFADALRQIN